MLIILAFHSHDKMETDDDDNLVCAVSPVVVALVARRKRRRPRSCWVRDWLRKRPQHGTHVALLSSLNGRHVSTCIQFAFTPCDTSGYKWIQMDTCIQSRAVFYWWTQVDTDTFCIRYKWIQVDTCSTRWIQVDTTGYNLYPVVSTQV